MALDRAKVLETVSKVYDLHGINNPAQEALHADTFIALWDLASEGAPPAAAETELLVTSVAVDPADPDVQAYKTASAELVRKYLPAEPVPGRR